MAHDTVNRRFFRSAPILKVLLRNTSFPARWLPRLGLTVLAWSLCAGTAWPQRNALPALGEGEGISLAAERQLGDRIIRELYRDPDYLEDPVLDEYILRLWTPLVDAAAARGELSPELRERFAWRILLGKDRSVNAFALPGGYLGVHLGLIAVVTSRDELASVLAHELSHVTQRHIARQMEAQGRMTPLVIGSLILGALAASKSPQSTQALIVGGQAAAMQSQLSYSRDMEREADRIGFGVLSDAGYDPRGFVAMFGKLQLAAGVNDNGAYPYLRSHPLTTERIADMQSRLPLGVTAMTTQQDIEQAMISARARVLSQSQVDSLRAWTQLPMSLSPQATPAQKAGSLYAAALAWQLLREPEQARQQWQALGALTATNTAAARLSRLLGAELQAARGEYAQVVQGLQPSSMVNRWPRPELVAIAQSLAHLPNHPATDRVMLQLRQQVQNTPYDAQAWNLLATLLTGQGQKLAALRAEGEAQLVRMDLQGALDRFRAAQDIARHNTTLAPGDHIEASIVDTRVRQIQEQMREMQKER
jgi:beta-barrel assembly-enhancing protease